MLYLELRTTNSETLIQIEDFYLLRYKLYPKGTASERFCFFSLKLKSVKRNESCS